MKHFLILFVTLCLCHGLSASPAVAGNDYDYEYEEENNEDFSNEAFSEAYAEAFAEAFAESYSRARATGGDSRARAGGGDASATGTGVVTIGGDVFEPTDLSKRPGTPASVGVDACGGGFSVSAPGVGATGTKPSRFCHLLTIAAVYQRLGERAVSPTVAADYLQAAAELRDDAKSNVKRRGRLTRFLHLDEIPVIGWLFFRD